MPSVTKKKPNNKETLTIENFAGIKKLKIEVKEINILIGPQAIGKSVVAKLLYFLKKIPYHFHSFISDKKNMEIKEFKIFCISQFNKYFPPAYLKKEEFTISYEVGYFSYKIINRKNKLSIIFPDIFTDIFSNNHNFSTKNTLNIFLIQDLSIPQESLYDKIIEILCPNNSFNQFFIPAGRSILTTLQKNIFSIISENMTIDPFMMEFGSLLERVKSVYNRSNKNYLFHKYCYLILDSKYIRENFEDFMLCKDQRRVGLSFSSSGQQEFFSLAIILSVLSFFNDKRTIYIEEPEAHLFPTAQKQVVELIATVFNTSKSPTQFFITTHSPYILTSINNLIQAGKLYSQITDKAKLKKLNKIVPKERKLAPGSVAAYVMDKKGCRNIIDKETGYIKADAIDDVSELLTIEFDQLLDME